MQQHNQDTEKTPLWKHQTVQVQITRPSCEELCRDLSTLIRKGLAVKYNAVVKTYPKTTIEMSVKEIRYVDTSRIWLRFVEQMSATVVQYPCEFIVRI